MLRESRRLTWGQILGVAAGVHQDVGLKGGVKVVICTEEAQRKEGVMLPAGASRRSAFGSALPVVEEDVRGPDLV